jgi:hypothetical protein
VAVESEGFERNAQYDGRMHVLIGVYKESEDFNNAWNRILILQMWVVLHSVWCL